MFDFSDIVEKMMRRGGKICTYAIIHFTAEQEKDEWKNNKMNDLS